MSFLESIFRRKNTPAEVKSVDVRPYPKGSGVYEAEPHDVEVMDYEEQLNDKESKVISASDAGKTIAEIAEESGVYPQLARYYLRKHDLPFKKTTPASKTRTPAEVTVPKRREAKPEASATSDVSILVIPDAHAKPDVPNDRFLWLGKYIQDTKPTIVVCLGDFTDMPSLSHYDIGKKSYEGRRYALDVEAAVDAQRLLFQGMGSYRPEKMVMTVGNHEDRINRAIEQDSKLEGTISTDDLKYEEFGWEVHKFKEIAMIHNIAFTHYFPNGLMDRSMGGENVAAGILKKYHCSAFQGHRHDLKFATDVHIDGRRITAVVAGCYFDHQETYVSKTVQKTYWRGLVHLHNVNNGEFDMEFVRLSQIERIYGRSDIAA